jgi:hypothetical protein
VNNTKEIRIMVKAYTKESIELAPADQSQLDPRILSVNGLSFSVAHDSSSRAQMTASQLGQALVIKGASNKIIQTGVESEFRKYTLGERAPGNILILEVLSRYDESGIGYDSIRLNPETVLIYEDRDTREIGMISLRSYCSKHTYFGFQYKPGAGHTMIRKGAFIPKDTVFLDSPNVSDQGDYRLGTECITAFITAPGGAEDAIVVSDQAIKKFRYNTYQTRTVGYGKDHFALNLYGNDDIYKPFPDIGDTIRSDGLLMALRPYEPAILAPVMMSYKDCQTVDYMFDKKVYADGPGGRVIDIIVHHDINATSKSPVIDKQALKYYTARKKFLERVLGIHKDLNKRFGAALRLTPEFSSLVVTAISVVGESRGNRSSGDVRPAQKVKLIHRQQLIDLFQIEFVIEYEIQANLGSKLTDLHGGKGVICEIKKHEEMPKDEYGHVAEIIVDPNGTLARMNLGRAYEPYLTDMADTVHQQLCQMAGIHKNMREKDVRQHLLGLPKESIESLFGHLYGMYKIATPEVSELIESGEVGADRIKYMTTILSHGITLWMPTDAQKGLMDVVSDLEESIYKPNYAPVQYVGNSGKHRTTRQAVRLGKLHILVLEKDGRDGNSVASPRSQVHGVPAQITKEGKYADAARKNPIRGTDEAGIRILAANCDEGEFAAEVIDRNNSPASHALVCLSILTADKPSNIDYNIDRVEHPLGSSRPMQFINHMAECAGWKFEFSPYVAK